MTNALEDRFAVLDTMANYCFYFDSAKFEQWVGLFTEDGVFDRGKYGVQHGRDELRAFTGKVPLSDGSPKLMHFVSNEIIRIEGDSARAESYILVVRPDGEGAVVNGLAGRYEDRLVRRDGRWLFHYRKVHFDYLGQMR